MAPFDRRIACALLTACLACGAPAARPLDWDARIPDTAAIRVSTGRSGEWLLLLETLQPQLLVTSPLRTAALFDDSSGITRRFTAPDGWILVDAVTHPSGEVSLLSLRVDSSAPYPLRVRISRAGAEGAVAELELARLLPVGNEPPPVFMTSLDRARIVAAGEDLYAVVRWANNSVQAYRVARESGGLRRQWVSWVEPAASLTFLGIIGGGFDNFHQGDSAFFVYADVDGRGNLIVGVASTDEVLAAHDAFFGEDLRSGADPARFDFGVAVVTAVGADGSRAAARLLGVPGRQKRLLNVRAFADEVALVGRIRTGDGPGDWDGWLLSFDPASGGVRDERQIDVQAGDALWDAAPLPDGRIVAVGATNYTQNPSGLSVSDTRDALGLVLDPCGTVLARIALPAGPPGRGNEAISVAFDRGGRVAIAGVQNAPGTHAAVYSDAFLALRSAQ